MYSSIAGVTANDALAGIIGNNGNVINAGSNSINGYDNNAGILGSISSIAVKSRNDSVLAKAVVS
jgi:hypothetical protein